MREIGSEFWNVIVAEKDNGLFPEHTQWFLSGRSSLQAIVEELKECHTVAMPSWCCDSMVKPFIDAGKDIHFYPVYWKDGLIQEIDLDCDVLFLMDYFGYSYSRNDSFDLAEYDGVVIRDITHSLLSCIYSDADYYFGSLRKWCGVWTGGFAWTRDGHQINLGEKENIDYISLRKEAMIQKAEYIRGKRSDKGYLNIFNKAEEILDNVGITLAADRDMQLARMIDVENIKNRRRVNSEILHKEFCDWLIFPEIKDNDCPMFVPIFVPKNRRNELKQYLINNEIYCPIHWPVSKFHRLDDKTQYIYENELSLVCDQRYIEEDMYRMVKTIKQFWKEVC